MSTVNQANSDRFKAVFSNIPMPDTRTTRIDMEIFNNFVRSITLPDSSIELTQSEFMNIVRRYPISKYNNDLSQLTIEFFADEDLSNYKAFFDWMKLLRYGCGNNADGRASSDTVIDVISVIMLDNQSRKTNTLTFDRCFLVSLSSLSLVFGSSEELQFSCTFAFDDFNIVSTTKVLNN